MLYVANTTKQNWNHHYRVIEKHRAYFMEIPSGSQVMVGHGWTKEQTDNVIRQLEKYGARPASEVSRKLENFPGLFYRTDRPISESEIVGGHDAVVESQERRSAVEATKAAAGFDLAQRDKRTKKRLAKVTEVSVEQDVPKNERPKGDEVRFSVGVSDDGQDDLSKLTR